MRKPWDYFDEFRDRFTALGADPVGIGALAAIRYRLEPRETTDVYFLVRRLDGVPEAMRALGYDVRELSEPGEPPYAVFIRGEDVQVDAIRAETEYQIEALRRATDGWLTVEDVIVHKLLAWRSRDQDDIASILATRPVLDLDYIEHWAIEWGVADRWQHACDEWASG